MTQSAREFFDRINAGIFDTTELPPVSPETAAWIRGISQSTADDAPPVAPLQLTEDMIVREETETPEGRTIRFSNWSATEGES